MTKDDIIAAVGEDDYRDACRMARGPTAHPPGGRMLRGDLPRADVPHEIADHLWGPDAPTLDRLRLLFEIYDEMPAYAHLMYLTHAIEGLSPEEREFLWDGLIERLGSEDPALYQPVEYFLWCDLLENPETVAHAWTRLTRPGQSETILRRVLSISGPVPWKLKRPVYDNLLPAPRWHEPIFQSLRASAFEYFGSVDKEDARRILGQLRLLPDYPRREELEERLRSAP